MFYDGLQLLPLWIALGIGAIALLVFLLRKFIPGLGFDNEPVDEKKQAEEEVNRYIVTEEIKEPKVEETKKDDEE